MVLIEEQRFESLFNKVEQIYDALINGASKATSDLNGFVSEDDATKLIGKSKTWLWRKRADGSLAFHKLGSKIYYVKDDLLNLFQEA
jgi:hypothetical protein